MQIVVGAGPNIDTRARPLQAVGRLAGRLQRLPCHFQEQALLRVHAMRLARGNAEKVWVKLIHRLLQPAGAVRTADTRHHRLAAWRRFGHSLPATAQQLPIGSGRIGPARKAASQSDHGDPFLDRRFLSRLLCRVKFLLHLFQRQKRPLERRQLCIGLLRMCHAGPLTKLIELMQQKCFYFSVGHLGHIAAWERGRLRRLFHRGRGRRSDMVYTKFAVQMRH